MAFMLLLQSILYSCLKLEQLNYSYSSSIAISEKFKNIAKRMRLHRCFSSSSASYERVHIPISLSAAKQ